MEAPGLGKFTYEAERKKVTLSMLLAVSKLLVLLFLLLLLLWGGAADESWDYHAEACVGAFVRGRAFRNKVSGFEHS